MNKVWKVLGKVVEANRDFIIHEDGRIAETTRGILLQFCKAGEEEILDLNRSKHVNENCVNRMLKI